jgi:hypothetical protein
MKPLEVEAITMLGFEGLTRIFVTVDRPKVDAPRLVQLAPPFVDFNMPAP